MTQLPSPLIVGSDAHHFEFLTAAGEQQNTQSLLGNPFLVYFYPRDDTPGCTKQACGLRDVFEDYTAAGITIIGVSCDDEKSHSKFRDKYSLPFPLASDTDQTIVKAYGVWGTKKFMGKVYDGIHRTSFLVDKTGKIAAVYEKVKPEAHASQVLEDAKNLF